MRIMRIYEAFGVYGGEYLFCKGSMPLSVYKTNFVGCFLAKKPHIASYSSYF